MWVIVAIFSDGHWSRYQFISAYAALDAAKGLMLDVDVLRVELQREE